MAFALFEENGDLKAGQVLADNGASLQVELVSGRRAKIKSAHVYMRFDSPPADALLPAALQAAEQIDIDFLWECAPQEEFGFDELAGEYFGVKPDPVQSAALLAKLKSAPIHFHRKGRGRFKAAPEETVRQALAAVEKRRAREALIESMADEMRAGRLPEAISARAAELLVRPDKMSLEWKAMEAALAHSGKSPERLLHDLGAFSSVAELHHSRFEAEQFPRGAGFPEPLAQWLPDAALCERIAALPESHVQAFSIDDSSTTEVDDAVSVQHLEDGTVRVGVHIAVPAIAIAPGDELDRLARERMSTAYMPDRKITMLPPGVVAAFSLDAGRQVPALSVYFDLDARGLPVRRYEQIERITVADNLRHDLLDDQYTEAALEAGAVGLPHGPAMAVLWQLMLRLCAERERVRGKPEPRFRSDFSFHVDGEHVTIVQRRRDAPLARIVAETMILANSEFGRLLADRGVAGIYRSQQGGRVRVSTQALPHEGLGVMQYAWTSSPLRRYIDLVNQRQLVAAVEGREPPLAPNSAELFSIVPAFEARHSAYQDFQGRMERYWCMRWLDQQPEAVFEAVAIRDDMVRLADAPLYFRADGAPLLAPGRRLRVQIDEYDPLDLSIRARFVEVVPSSGGVPERAAAAAAALGIPTDDLPLDALGALDESSGDPSGPVEIDLPPVQDGA